MVHHRFASYACTLLFPFTLDQKRLGGAYLLSRCLRKLRPPVVGVYAAHLY